MHGQQALPIAVLESTVEHAIVSPARAMIHAPTALLVLERNLAGAIEQRIVLPNPTAVRGDNVLQVRAQTAASIRGDEFGFAEVATRFGGLPAPFEGLDPAMLLSGSDALGNYVYARQTLGTETTCVLVLRRLAPTARPLPRGTNSLDMMLRNCVVGGVEQALAPIDPRLLGVGGAPQAAVYTLSPFAAPQR